MAETEILPVITIVDIGPDNDISITCEYDESALPNTVDAFIAEQVGYLQQGGGVVIPPSSRSTSGVGLSTSNPSTPRPGTSSREENVSSLYLEGELIITMKNHPTEVYYAINNFGELVVYTTTGDASNYSINGNGELVWN